MHKTIHKFEISHNQHEIRLPDEAKFLSVGKRPDQIGGEFSAWFEVPDEHYEADMLKRFKCLVVGTGHSYRGEDDGEPRRAAGLHYAGTAIDGDYVWHLFLPRELVV